MVSATEVQSILNDAVLDVFESKHKSLESRIEKALTRADERLRQPPKGFTVWLQVMGIRLNADVSVGAVRFTTRGRVAESRKTLSVLKEHPPADPFDAWAVIDVTCGDSDAAFALASYQLQLALDVVNLYAGWFDAARDSAAYRPGVRSFYRSVAMTKSGSMQTLPRHMRVGPYPLTIRAMHRFPGYRRIAKLISLTGSLTAGEERLLSAIRWIGRGVVSAWAEHTFLSFVVAMESLVLGPNKDTDLNYRLKTRIARLLARKGHEASVFATVGKLYAARSAIVHKGSLRVEMEKLDTARAYATMTLFLLLRRPGFAALQTEDDVDAWFLAQDLRSGRRRVSATRSS